MVRADPAPVVALTSARAPTRASTISACSLKAAMKRLNAHVEGASRERVRGLRRVRGQACARPAACEVGCACGVHSTAAVHSRCTAVGGGLVCISSRAKESHGTLKIAILTRDVER